MPKIIGSILQGAYGDYYWQASALKVLLKQNPDWRLKLFTATPGRLHDLRTLDLSFGESVEVWDQIPKHHIDQFLQYQILDPDFQRDILANLPADIQNKFDRSYNRLFWNDLRSMLPLPPADAVGLSEEGRRMLPEMMTRYGIDPGIYQQRPTIGFVWRFRAPVGAIHPFLQPPAPKLVEKYSKVLQRLIKDFDCHVLITGMKVPKTEENAERVGSKYPSFGLDLPEDRCSYLGAQNWPIDVEIIRRCTTCLTMSSGFSEAVDNLRGSSGVYLVDAPLHYMGVLTYFKVSLFHSNTLSGLFRIWNRPHSENRIYKWLAAELRNWRPA